MFITKALTIFVILGYAGVHAKCSEQTGRLSKECLKEIHWNPDDFVERLPNGTLIWYTEEPDNFTEECLKQYEINPDVVKERITEKTNKTIILEQLLKEITPEKFGCIYACIMKKKLEDKKTIKKHITDSLNGAETKYTKAEMDELRDIVEKCIIKEKEDECKLFECLEPWQNERLNKIILNIRNYNRKIVLMR